MENAVFPSGARTARSDAYDPAGIRVLAVEEDPSYLTTLTQMLQRHGYQVTAKASPEEGLRALQDNLEGFDLVMTVARTQGTGIDGFELLKHAKKRYPVVLLFTGDEPRETVMRALVGGACDFLTKPLHDDEVRRIWQHVLRRKIKMDSASGAKASADARINDDVVRQDDTARKRGPAGLYDSDEGDSHGVRQQKQKQGRTTKRPCSTRRHCCTHQSSRQENSSELWRPFI